MTELIRFALIGLGIGALYGLIALGLVLVYRGSGVLNFAQGAFVMVGAFAQYEFKVKHDLPTWLSVVLAVGIGAVVGAATHLVVLRPMRRSSPLTRVVATLGIMIILQSLAVIRYGVDVRAIPSYISTRRLEFIDGAPIGLDRMIILAICASLVLVLWVVYRFSSFGRVTSAVAENERAAASLGHSPHRIATRNWATGGALAAFAGTLIGPITYLQPTQLTLLVVPAIAAALVGGFSSFPIAFLGALGIGMLESWLQRYAPGTPGAATTVPFLIVIGVLVLRGRGLPLRSHIFDRLPAVWSGKVRPVPTIVVFALLAVALYWLLPTTWVAAFSVTMTFAILCLSVLAVTGLAGQLSLMQYVLAGVGALVAARVVEWWNWPFSLALLAALIVAVALGAIVALPALRTRGINLAIVTLGLGTVIHTLVLNNSKYTGGMGGIRVPTPSFFGWSLDPIRYPERYAVLVLVALFASALALANLRRGTAGRRLVAVRSNERAAAAVGINVYGAKIYAFCLASALAAVAGVLISFRNSTVIASQFEVFPSITIVGMTVVGGVGSVGGAILGSTLLQGGVGSETLRGFQGLDRYLPLIGGIMLLQVLMTDQNGLLSMNLAMARQMTAKLKGKRRGEAEPAPTAPTTAADRADSTSDVDDRPQRRTIPSTRERVRPEPLRVVDMTVRFGGVVAVNSMSLTVEPGQVHGLIGPNGAGKTTLIDGVTGFVRPSGGQVLLGDHDITSWSARRRAAGGLTRSFQSLELFGDLTVRENIAVACDRGRSSKYLTDLVHPGKILLTAAADAVIDEFELGSVLDLKPESLPFGQRRLVGIARAVASDPSALMLDEPASGLSGDEADELRHVIRRLADERGMAVLLVEHNIDLVLNVSDVITVMRSGSFLTRGTPSDIRVDQDVLDAYLGHDDNAPAGEHDATVATALL